MPSQRSTLPGEKLSDHPAGQAARRNAGDLMRPGTAVPALERLDAGSLLDLQRTAGNQAVGTLVAQRNAPAAAHAPAPAAAKAGDSVADSIQHDGRDPNTWTKVQDAKVIVANQFFWLMMQQLPGLNEWKEAANYREKHVEWEIIKALAIGAVAAATEGVGVAVAEGAASLVEQQFAAKLTELSEELILEATKESLKAGIESGMSSYEDWAKKNGQESMVEAFYWLQYGLITEAANIAQSQFLGRKGPYFDTVHPQGKALDMLRDQVLLLRAQQKRAKEAQYEASVLKWAAALAQSEMGVVKAPSKKPGEAPGLATDMSGEALPSGRGKRGVLTMHAQVDIKDPRAPFKWDMAHLPGLSEPMHAVYEGKTIDEMKIPLTLIIDAGLGMTALIVSRNEAGMIFVGSLRDDPKMFLWLRDRYNPRPSPVRGPGPSPEGLALGYKSSPLIQQDGETLVSKDVLPFTPAQLGVRLDMPSPW